MAWNGEASFVPVWALVLLAAEDWGIPPWRVVAECDEYWWKRWIALRQARGESRRA